MTLDIRALAEQAGMDVERREPLHVWRTDDEALTRFARAVQKQTIEECLAIVRKYGMGEDIIAKQIAALLPSEPK